MVKKKKVVVQYQSFNGDIIYLDLTNIVHPLIPPPAIQMYDAGAGKCVDYIYLGREL